MTASSSDWHDELVLMAELSSVNNQIARFVLRLLDADAGRKEQVSVVDEGRLGVRLVDLGHALQDRAAARATRMAEKRIAREVPGSILRLEPGRGKASPRPVAGHE
ncbi:hypothetical protein [Actinophytocola sp.]|uniref:hypothetical protein n=1 Tax=Actinophytocola sp. TaxID=1872138 RepID=UPI002D7E6181|nr:hypothetical protein [Actinophytocola sp.]HET9139944.1 hypothetical protein [Actinophytocola sp.]